MSEQMIAYCGLVCTECPAYRATRTGDETAARATAAQWSRDYGITVAVDDVWCDGCLVAGRKCAHCAECEVRRCGQEHAVANCGRCQDYATCERLAAFLQMVPHAKRTLDAVRQAGG